METIKTNNEQLYLTENRERLALKLEEYRGRIEPFRAPELQLDTMYKIAVLEPLVQTGTVDRSSVSQSIMEKYGRVDDPLFHNAWGVIKEYIADGGVNLINSTGLPTADGGESLSDTTH